MLTAKEIFEHPAIRLSALVGDPDRAVTTVSALDTAAFGALTFAGDKVALSDAPMELSGVTVICSPLVADRAKFPDCTLLVCENPRLGFMRAIRVFFAPQPPALGIAPTAVVHPTAQIDVTASIGPYCVIADRCVVGPRSVLHAHVTLYGKVRIGSDVVVNAGTVIGADGFGYERNDDGILEKFLHIGGVIIEDHVEIGSNTSIDRGTLGDTRICEGARIDNQVHISHNVVIGPRCAVIAQAMIGGSVKIGTEAWIAPSAVLMNQIKVGARATVGLAAVVTKNVSEGQIVMGSPAQDSVEFRATRAAMRRLIDN